MIVEFGFSAWIPRAIAPALATKNGTPFDSKQSGFVPSWVSPQGSEPGTAALGS